jgi:hypothetical protein
MPGKKASASKMVRDDSHAPNEEKESRPQTSPQLSKPWASRHCADGSELVVRVQATHDVTLPCGSNARAVPS